jgi:hypothetical protein
MHFGRDTGHLLHSALMLMLLPLSLLLLVLSFQRLSISALCLERNGTGSGLGGTTRHERNTYINLPSLMPLG